MVPEKYVLYPPHISERQARANSVDPDQMLQKEVAD